MAGGLDPLNSTALLVSGTQAFAGGELRQAERLLLAAAERDPFAPAPRFLLADLYLRQGRGKAGLVQLDYLLRRVGPAAVSLLPALVQFARTPNGARQLRALVSTEPDLRERLLELLAADPSNLQHVLTLAGPRTQGAAPQWQATLLTAMLARQDYQRSHQLWLRFAGLRAGGGSELFNSRFLPGGPPPPFNWRFNSGSAGVAEAQPGSGLHVIYYGRADAVLAEQMLLLPPGRYRLQHDATGSSNNLSWAVVCLPGGSSQSAPASGDLRFMVATTCKAQRLELRGSIGEAAETVDMNIRQIRIEREGKP